MKKTETFRVLKRHTIERNNYVKFSSMAFDNIKKLLKLHWNPTESRWGLEVDKRMMTKPRFYMLNEV